MDVFLYFNDRLPVGLDELEDALDAAFGDKGGVTGAGTGEMGSNLDLFIKDRRMTVEEVVEVIRNALAKFAVPRRSKIVIGDGEYTVLQDAR